MENQTPPSGYGIGAVTRLTGLPGHTLRIWERRYRAVEAARSASGRRLYSDADVARLLLLKHLVDRGERIGRIANLGDAQLRARLERHAAHQATREQIRGRPRVAVLGELLVSKLEAGLADCELVTTATDQAVFAADIKGLRPDVLIVEQAAISPDTRPLLAELRAASGAQRVILVFGFASHDDLAHLADPTTLLVRAPADPAELSRLVHSPPALSTESPLAAEAADALGVPDQIAPRRYSAADLARLRQVQGTVECECPAHLVELVTSLSAFEVYSAQCESRNPADAALHASLHRTTAQARALMEEALTRVARAEGLV